MKNKEVAIIKSESWIRAGLMEQDKILNNAIKTYMEDGEEIINIQCVDVDGLKRFWIYTRKS